MTDELQNSGTRDRTRIDIDAQHELMFWTKNLGAASLVPSGSGVVLVDTRTKAQKLYPEGSIQRIGPIEFGNYEFAIRSGPPRQEWQCLITAIADWQDVGVCVPGDALRSHTSIPSSECASPV